jgi:hypothetical protein
MNDNWVVMVNLFKKDNIQRLIVRSATNTGVSYECVFTKSYSESAGGGVSGFYVKRLVSNEKSIIQEGNIFLEDLTPQRVSCYAIGSIWGMELINV